MTDPFFQNQPTTSPNNWVVPPANVANNDIQHIIDQQKEIEENFKKLKALFSEPNLSVEQKQQIKQKLLELKEIYAENKKKLENSSSQNIQQGVIWWAQQGGTNVVTQTVHVNKIDAVEDKTKRTGFSMKNIFIWCGLLFLLLIWWVAFLFYYMITHPAELKNIGMAPENVKQLLQTFTVVFFWAITLIGFIFFIINIYRIFSSKRKSKISYFFGILLAIFFLWGGIVWGTFVIQKVNTISVDDITNNSNLIRPYLLVKEKTKYIGDGQVNIIWPTQIAFSLSTNLFTKQIAPKIPGKIIWLTLSCWNWQELEKNNQNEFFKGKCFYRYEKDSNFSLTLNIKYIDQATSEQIIKPFNVRSFKLSGLIKVFNQKNELLNDKTSIGDNNEILGGIAGDTLTFDASEIFKKIGLKNYKISWDFDGDGNIDRENETKANYRYTKAGVFFVSIRFPELNNELYTFPIRIEQSEVPTWTINSEDLWKNQYHFNVDFFEKTETITKYIFQVINKEGKVINSEEKLTNSFNYTFKRPWEYKIKTLFVTQDNAQWEIISKSIIIEDIDVDFKIKVFNKFINQEEFQKTNLEKTWENNDFVVTISDIPNDIKININKNEIENKGYVVSAKYDKEPLIFIDNDFKVTIDSLWKHEIILLATNKKNNKKIEQKIKIKIKREWIIGKLLISPDNVGTSPFIVKFDASTSQVNDPNDEIVYFTWDFGDGEKNIKRNTSESIVEHTYFYDEKNNNWEFHPKLHIKTRKGREYDIGEKELILIKQPLKRLDINIDSHPAQVAKVNDIVQLSLQLDGLPKKIYWDFGNGENTECKGRSCIETKKIYHKAGEYKIKVKVEYLNRIPLEWSITLLVK